MSPKLGASKKQKTTVGSSSTQRPRDGSFNHNKFLGPDQEFRTYVTNALGHPTKFNRWDLNTAAQVLMTLVLYNIRPMSNTSSIPMDTAYLLYYIIDEGQVYVERIIANEMKMIASSGHHLGNRTPSALAFPGLIIGLCQKARVSLPYMVHETIDGEVNDRYIERHCVPRSGCLILIIALVLERNSRLMLIGPREDHFNQRKQLVLKWRQMGNS
ncbi:hypothetical protein KIW84_032175 [Lathyrus oleraceus]|uniref:Putative plant transposon protein domain-containing protein n=1 Tax=Pisum sativum TaxID=3888 RepID=A0A9D4XXU8_PEA|nr:hypothetical protein KIW84_032175 [Pisum sativum]